MRTEQPEVSLKTDPKQNKVVRDGRLSPVSRLSLHLNDDGTVELDAQTTNGYVPVTLTLTKAMLTEFATQWLRIDAAKRLLSKWRKIMRRPIPLPRL